MSDDDLTPVCPISEHVWGPWEINDFFPLREDRFCDRCGAMEYQWICTDPNCSEGDHEHE